MSIKTLITSTVVSAIAAGSLVPLASAANARDFDGHRDGTAGYSKHSEQFGGHGGHNRGWDHDRGWNRRGGQQFGDYRHRRHYGHHRDHTGRNLAIGAFATILGIAIAPEVRRDRGYGYGYRD